MTGTIKAEVAEARLIKAGFECHRAANNQWIYATDAIGTARLNIDKNGNVEYARLVGMLRGKGFDHMGERIKVKTYGVQNVQGLIDIFEARAKVADRRNELAKDNPEGRAWRAAIDILNETEFVGWKQSP